MASAALGVLACSLSVEGCAPRGAPPDSSRGTQRDVTFTEYSALASDAEMARRVLTPLTHRVVQEQLSATGRSLRERPVDLSQERFSFYVPAGGPPGEGYGLLVFVAPWREATRPRRWRRALDRHRFVFVSAERSGNDVEILDRRLPLALLAYWNVRALLPIDARRVYVAGFSGGSRVAQIAALAYPDLFRGALLNAGSEPIDGGGGVYVPPRDLFRMFQQSRLVFVTGEKDEENLRNDDRTRASLKERCVFGVEVRVARRLGHEPLDPVSLDRALEALDRPWRADPEVLERCNARLEREVTSRLAEAEAAIERGDRDGALDRLKAIDARYGGLAAPAILELEARRTAVR